MKFNIRELGTVLAALRCYQEVTGECGGDIPKNLLDIATNCGDHEALSVEEIDDLCEQINRG